MNRDWQSVQRLTGTHDDELCNFVPFSGFPGSTHCG
jgi:hypothetical protein